MLRSAASAAPPTAASARAAAAAGAARPRAAQRAAVPTGGEEVDPGAVGPAGEEEGAGRRPTMAFCWTSGVERETRTETGPVGADAAPPRVGSRGKGGGHPLPFPRKRKLLRTLIPMLSCSPRPLCRPSGAYAVKKTSSTGRGQTTGTFNKQDNWLNYC